MPQQSQAQTPTPLTAIDDTKRQLQQTLSQPSPDDILINGILNFARGRFIQLILKDINSKVGVMQNTELQMAQHITPRDQTADVLLDRAWSDFYYPVFKYYSAQHQALAQHSDRNRRRKPVELRKMNTKFLKTAKLSRDFFYDLLKHVLTQFNVGPMIPYSFYELLGLTLDPEAIQVPMKNQEAMLKILYVAHRTMLFIGATSRYRSTMAQYLDDDSKENFHQALDMCHHAELLLPAYGEARNQIGMIYNSRGMKMHAAYEFLRSSYSRVPSALGAKNFQAILRNTTAVTDKLNALRMENNAGPENRTEYISVYFLCLYGYYVSPGSWMRTEGILKNGTKIEELTSDWIKQVRLLATEGDESFLFEKMLLMLIAGIVSLNPRGGASSSTSDETKALLKFTFKYVVQMEESFVDLWESDYQKSLKLLPFLRIIYSWLKDSPVAINYSHRNFHFLVVSAKVTNLIVAKNNVLLTKRPTREQYFKEDVGVKEFTPIDTMLGDFNDGHLFSDEEAQARLIGTYFPHDQEEEDRLRLLAVSYMCKKILMTRKEGVTFDADKKEVVLSEEIVETLRKYRAKMASTTKSKASVPTSNNRKPQKNGGECQKTVVGMTPETQKRKSPQKKKDIKKERKSVSKKYTPPPVSSSDDSDVESISEEVFNARKFALLKLNEKENDKNSTAPTTAAVNAQDSEDRLVNSKQSQYVSMVNSLVDDAFTGAGSNQNGTASSTNWKQTTEIQQGGPNFGFSAYNGAFSPGAAYPYNSNSNSNSNITSPFPSYQNYYPMYQSPQPQQPQMQQPQLQQPQNTQLQQHTPQQIASPAFQQYAGIYGQQQFQSPQPYQQYSPYGTYGQSAVVQVRETPSQPTPPQQQNQQNQKNGLYPPGSYYPYGAM